MRAQELTRGGGGAVAAVPKVCAPPLAWYSHVAWGALEQILRHQTSKGPRQILCPQMTSSGHQQHRYGQVHPNMPLSSNEWVDDMGHWVHSPHQCQGPCHGPW